MALCRCGTAKAGAWAAGKRRREAGIRPAGRHHSCMCVVGGRGRARFPHGATMPTSAQATRRLQRSTRCRVLEGRGLVRVR